MTDIQSEWISVEQQLPLMERPAPVFTDSFVEEELDVLVDGVQQRTTFRSGWVWEMSFLPDTYPIDFIMEFAVDGVTHWRRA